MMVGDRRVGHFGRVFIRAAARSFLWGLMPVCGCTHEKLPDEKSPDTPAQASPPTAIEAKTTNERAAQSAAVAWLALVDAGNYAQSWTESASYFKKAVDQPGWEKALNGVRAPLGKVLLRTMKSATYATSLPGAPDGEYVAIKFDATFENKKIAIETVTPMREPDGRWRVSGYFIK